MLHSASPGDRSLWLPLLFLRHRSTVVPPRKSVPPVKTVSGLSVHPGKTRTTDSITPNSDGLDSFFTVLSPTKRENCESVPLSFHLHQPNYAIYSAKNWGMFRQHAVYLDTLPFSLYFWRKENTGKSYIMLSGESRNTGYWGVGYRWTSPWRFQEGT